RHSPPAAAPAAPGSHAAVAGAVPARAAGVAAVVVGHAEAGALPAGVETAAAGAAAGPPLAVAAGLPRRVDARPGIARRAPADVQGLVEEPTAMSARDAILGRIRNALANEPAVELPPPPELWPAGTWAAPRDL